ncbi:MAG: hypothetical protein N2482_00760 [Patescibacteria group bacterium]|nr:hypothetical protein [Patescibacteria group bacterium]
MKMFGKMKKQAKPPIIFFEIMDVLITDEVLIDSDVFNKEIIKSYVEIKK